MYKQHEHFLSIDDDTKIWKYLDLFKYLDLISSKTLFMLKADKFQDPFDGKGPDKEYLKKVFELSIGTEVDDSIIDNLHNYYDKLRRSSYVNCWHINNFESSVMWDAYSNANGGLVIESTFGELKKSIVDSRDIYISKVVYDRNRIGLQNAMHALTHKKQEFQDERELRVFHVDTVGSDPDSKEDYLNSLDIFLKIEVDTSVLIKQVYFHPLTPEWVASSIKSVVAQYGSQFIPVKSTLYTI